VALERPNNTHHHSLWSRYKLNANSSEYESTADPAKRMRWGSEVTIASVVTACEVPHTGHSNSDRPELEHGVSRAD
jgi:hypothetical protein